MSNELPFTPIEPGTEEPLTIPDRSVPHAKLPPGEWLRKNLFNNWYNSVLTVVLGIFILWASFMTLRFVFVTARWRPVTENLTLFMVGRFPRDELWRVDAQVVIWAAAMGLAWGAAVSGSKFRALQAGVEYAEDPPLARVRRYWGILLLLGILLAATETPGPLLLTIGALAAGAILYMIGSRVPGQYAGVMWAAVGFLLVLGYQIVSGFTGNGWIWMALPIVIAAVSSIGRGDWTDLRRMRFVQAGTGIAIFVVMFAVYAATDLEGVGWDKWEGFHLNLIAATVAITLSFPLGLLLALGRRSSFPALRVMSTVYI